MQQLSFDYESNTDILNTILEGDTIEKMKLIEDKSIDFILVDLPYGTTQNKWDSVIPLDDLWKEYHRIIKDNGVMAFTASGLFSAQLMLSNIKEYKYKYIWVKSKATNFLNAKKQPLRKFEEVLIFYKKQPTYHPQMLEGEAYNKGIRKDQLTGSYGKFSASHVQSTGERYPTDILYFKTAEAEGEVIHPTQKPVALGQFLIKTYTNPGDTVLDNTSGSGAFLVAALKEGRNFIGIEKNEFSELFKKETINYIEKSEARLLNEFNNLDEFHKKYISKTGLFRGKV
ncbi:DNA-methyltransferase [Macrococcus bovicus]|uniref:Methyltransferase n=1 Tax=Macrococcus bovicus TaxID=69968 RepID=A0A4R6C014_9STAP|nr:site-specific DNA-methyltransferase [Macrococcus bovicus]TDM14319.1 site-specific DNA-methyltransferase [Macrococcus bovicus]